LINVGNNEGGSSIGEEEVYNSKREKLVLALLSESYSELNAISVDTSSTLLVYLILFTDYLYY